MQKTKGEKRSEAPISTARAKYNGEPELKQFKVGDFLEGEEDLENEVKAAKRKSNRGKKLGEQVKREVEELRQFKQTLEATRDRLEQEKRDIEANFNQVRQQNDDLEEEKMLIEAAALEVRQELDALKLQREDKAEQLGNVQVMRDRINAELAKQVKELTIVNQGMDELADSFSGLISDDKQLVAYVAYASDLLDEAEAMVFIPDRPSKDAIMAILQASTVLKVKTFVNDLERIMNSFDPTSAEFTNAMRTAFASIEIVAKPALPTRRARKK